MLYIISLAVLFFGLPKLNQAHAYLDPGNGSYMLQIAIGLFIGSAVAVRTYWSRIITFLKQITGKRPDTKSKA